MVKRTVDVLGAGAALVVLSPVLAVIAVAIRAESPGPVLYRARRAGRVGTTITVHKFRKMDRTARGERLTAAGDARLTRVGAFLVRYRLDELPQLWDVVTGRMSLVGPRPEDPVFVASYPEVFDRVLSVRPGLTGVTQLVFADESTLLPSTDAEAYYVDVLLPRKLWLDETYVRTHSTGRDLRILLWTVLCVAFGLRAVYDAETGEIRLQRPDDAPVPVPSLPRAS